ncbi:histone H2A-IV-like [Aegilops tauschii subsp. strangulata]|uniref:Histone H2A n=1 Tax=Aegilops tauschii TaxID=37682 RepID=M8B1P0_AEGTA
MAIAGSGRGESKPTASTKSMSRSSMAGLQIPVSRVTRYLRVGSYTKHGSTVTPVYLATKILEPAGNTARGNKKNRIMPRHIQPAVCNDEELSRLLCAFTVADDGLMPDIHTVLLPRGPTRPRTTSTGKHPSTLPHTVICSVCDAPRITHHYEAKIRSCMCDIFSNHVL